MKHETQVYDIDGEMPLSSVKGSMRTVNYFFHRSIICSLEDTRSTQKKKLRNNLF